MTELAELTDSEFERFRKYIYSTTGISIGEHKRTLVSNRVRRRLRATGTADYSSYFRFLQSPAGKEELPSFLDEITTNETYFLRDPHQYEWLRKEFYPEMANQARSGTRPRKIRIWSAACSTGEEPYSIALCATQSLVDLPNWNLEIVGTDISERALAKARAGEYSARAVQLMGEVDKRRHFRTDANGETWHLSEMIKKHVKFRNHNLMDPMTGPFFDCIFIKNVLIYFDDESKKKVVANLIAALAPGGFLVVGPSEGIFTMLSGLEKLKTWLYRKPT